MRKVIRMAILLVSIFFAALITDAFAHPAWGIVVDQNRQIYFSDLETIYKIDSQGKLSIFRAGVSGRHIHDLSIDASGNLYGWENVYEPRGEKHLRAFWKMSPAGEYTEMIALTETPPTGMSIWRDAGGNTYSVEPWNNEKRESKIIKRTAAGESNLFAGGKYGYLDGQKAKAEFSVIMDMVFGNDGAIYLTDDNKVRRIDALGVVKTIFPADISTKNPESSSKFYGLDVDKNNNVLACDFANGRLLKISSDGKVTTLLKSEKDWSPLGAAAFGEEVYVLEGRPYSASAHAGNRVLKVSAAGDSTIVANLEDRNKSTASLKSESVNFLPETQEQKNTMVNNDNEKPVVNRLGVFGIVGVISVALIALLILVRKNSK